MTYIKFEFAGGRKSDYGEDEPLNSEEALKERTEKSVEQNGHHKDAFLKNSNRYYNGKKILKDAFVPIIITSACLFLVVNMIFSSETNSDLL